MTIKNLVINSFKISLLGLTISLAGCLSKPPLELAKAGNSHDATNISGGSQASNVTAKNTDKNAEESAELALTDRHNFELSLINKMLKRFHYKKFDLNDSFSEKILEQYIKQLDPSKIYFTQTDIEGFNLYKHKFDNFIDDGNTDIAVGIFKTYQTRVKERSEYATKKISKKLDLSNDENYILDRKEANWEKNIEALNLLWDKRIENDYINQVLAEKKHGEIITSLKKRYANIAKRTSQIKPNELFQTIANSYASAIEPHTSYLSPRSSEQFDIQMSLSLSGIGAVLRTDDEHTKIISVVPGGPADLTGKISAGDRIVGVGQDSKNTIKDIVGWRLTDVVNVIRGEKGSTVVLSVLPNETGLSGKPETVSIVRDKIKLEHQAASKRIIDIGADKVGVITLPSFYIDFKARSRGDTDYAGTTRDVKKLLLELKEEGIKSLIIDLRANGGGSLSEVVTLTDLFIDRGPVVQINDTNGRTDILKDNDSGVVYDGPMAVLIDKGSASASEIFAGAIQDYKRGIIIGETTFGKGTVQTVLPLNSYTRKTFDKPLGELKITTAQFFRVNGDSTQHKGVVPDISWNLPKVDGDLGERAYKNALPWRQIDEAQHTDFPMAISQSAVKRAEALSVTRRNKTPKYVTTFNRMKLLIEAGNEKTLSLNLTKRKEKREAFNKQLLTLENKLQVANGEPAYKTIKELRDAQEKKNDDIFSKKKPIDVFLKEAAQILHDLSGTKLFSASK